MVTIFSTAILLLAFFDFHVCQRKVSRNVAVGADVKTVVNFDCPEEFGYYPHPNDCTQYYVCVFGGALLESCTGGLMYSHELQTCDWPRNVGCDGAELSGGPVTASSPRAPAKPREEQTRTRYPPTPQPPQPAAIVTSRGQPRPLHHSQQEIIKQRQQQQLYTDAEETLPPAEEVENDRQQRVYRGQPSTVGQVQRDRDGLRHTNAIPSYSGRNGKIGVISFGTQHQQSYSTTIIDINNNDLTLKRRRKRQVQVSHHQRYPESWRVEKNQKNNYIRTTPLTLQPPPLQPHFSQRYPQQHYAQNSEEFKPFVPQYKRNNYRTHTVANKIPFSQTPVSNHDYQNYAYFNIGSVTTYRPPGTNPKKLETVYYNNEPQYSHISNQNISKLLVSTTLEPTTTDEPKLEEPLENYDEENKEKDNEEFTFYEDLRPPPSYFDSKNKYEEIENPFANPDFDFDKFLDGLRGYPSAVPKQQQAQETSLPRRNQTVPQEYYFYDNDYRNITNSKPPLKSKNLYSSQVKPTAAISLVKTTNKPSLDYYYEYDFPEYSKAIDPNEKYYYYEDAKRPKYSAKYQEKPLKAMPVRITTTYTTPHTVTSKKRTTITTAAATTTTTTTTPAATTTTTTTTTTVKPKPKHIRQRVNASTRKQKTARPPTTSTTTTTTTTTEKRLRLTNTIDDDNVRSRVEPSSSAPVQAPTSTVPTVTARTLYNSTQYNSNNNNNNYDPYYALYDDDVELYRDVDYAQHYSNNNNNNGQNQTPRRTPAPVIHQTAIQEEPPKRGNTAYIQNNYGSQDIYQPSTVSDYNEDNNYNTEEDDQNAYRQQQINRQPTRGNRNELNYIEDATTKRAATTTTRKPTTTSTTAPRTIPFKSTTTRTNTRGRGSAHYANSGNIINNEVSVTVNRGTPASRSRPTLKPSTSIVAKASEFIDIYKFPPTRPEAIYPQPQPDKTAAKCRKDVCLLPDCSCGGKEIPGDIPVEQVPQIVLLTFDDSVNDLNKGLYSDLFEKGRVNPNGCPIAATFYVSHEWTDYSQVQNLYADGHELASHTVSHSFGEQFSQKKWTREVSGQREILSAYGGVRLEDVKGMRAPFLSVGGNKMFKMLYDSNFTYDSSMPIYENKPPSWPYTLDYKLFHDCMIPPCPTRSYPGVWEVPMVMWQDLNGGRCSMGDACSNPPDAEGVFKMITKNFQRHYTTNRAPFGLFYHAAWFTQPHHKEGFINFLDSILSMKDVWLVTNWQAIQWIRDPTPISRLGSFQPFQCDYSNRPKRCNAPKVCNLWHKSGVRYMRTCQPCPDIYPWTGNTGIRSSRIDNDIIEE